MLPVSLCAKFVIVIDFPCAFFIFGGGDAGGIAAAAR